MTEAIIIIVVAALVALVTHLVDRFFGVGDKVQYKIDKYDLDAWLTEHASNLLIRNEEDGQEDDSENADTE